MIRNFVLESANAPGANLNVILAGAPVDRVTWRAAYADGASAYYFIDDGSQGEWGVGTVHWGTPNTLSRDTVVGNTAGNTNRLTFTGAVQVYNEIPGERMAYINGQVLWAPGAHLNSQAGGVPIGASMDYWGGAAPSGWQFCDGRWLSRTQYALLFSVIGTTYGTADGASYFAVPDCQGVATYGKDKPAVGGNVNNTRLGPWQASPMGAGIGDWQLQAHNHGLNWSDPGHAHLVTDPGHLHNYFRAGIIPGPDLMPGSGYTIAADANPTDQGFVRQTGVSVVGAYTGISASIQSNGSGVWQNLSPGIVCNKIIYCGPVP